MPALLLDLPAELRNHIYELVLIQDGTINITTPLPSLLSTCRQFRIEGRDLYFRRNKFEHAIKNFDNTKLQEWEHLMQPTTGITLTWIDQQFQDRTLARINLMAWLKAVMEDGEDEVYLPMMNEEIER